MSETIPGKKTIQDNMVVTLDYVLKVDGEVIDQSGDTGSIEFLQGQGQVIPGLEKAIYGMAVGETKQFNVLPADAYGHINEDDFAEIPLDEFPEGIPLEEGVELQLKDQDGELFEGFIQEVRQDIVLLNFNHPLAGKELDFEVTVVDLRSATAEELDHGHAHSGHTHE